MKRYFILFILTVSTGIIAFAQQDSQTVATIQMTKSETITVKQLKDEIKRNAWKRLSDLGRIPSEAELNREIQNSALNIRNQTLNIMINDLLILQAAERDRITLSESELNQQVTQFRVQLGQVIGRQPTDNEFAFFIKQEYGLELPLFRESIRRQTIIQKYKTAKIGDQLRSIRPPTENEIIEFLNLNKEQFTRPDTVRFSAISVPFGHDATTKTRARELAEKLNREIGQNPTRFDETAMKSHAPNSGFVGGDTGYLPRTAKAQQMFGAELMNTAFSLRQGEISRLIEGQAGYQIIKVTEKYEQKNLGLDDIYMIGTSGTVREVIRRSITDHWRNEVQTSAVLALVAELRAASTIRIMDNNLNW